MMKRIRESNRRGFGRAVMQMSFLTVTVAALCASSALAPSCRTVREPTVTALGGELAARVDTITREDFARQNLVGLSLAIARAEGTVHVAHFGFEDRERGVSCSDATLYRLASISKPITAVVAMQLAREGKLDLSLDVHDYVPEFPAQLFPITARQLLCHQGGIVHYTNGPVVETPPRTDVAHPFEDAVDALTTFAASPLVCEPGTQYSYSTHGYMLLGAVLQRAAGERFEDLVSKRIADPLAMTTLRPDKQWIEIPHRTIGYRKDTAGAIVPSIDSDVSWKLAGGGFICCVEDLARFGSGMLECRVVERTTREQMWTAQLTKSGAITEYGLGFRVDSYRGERLIFHSGSQEKTRTRILFLPERDLVVVLMCNSEWADLQPLGQRLLDALIDAQ